MISDKISRILLVSANRMTNPYPVFPLGLAFLEAGLKEAGYSVRIWDQLIHPLEELWQGLDWADAAGISLRNVDNVSSTAPEGYLDEYVQLLGMIRERSQLPLLAGGSAFSIFPAEMLDSLGLKWGIQGEAEKAIVQWLAALNGDSSMEEVPGLLYRNGDGSIRQNPQVVIPAEEIPSPRPDHALVAAYLKRGGMMNVQSQRGCAFRCTYCTYPWIEGKCYRHRNPEDIVEEIRHLQAAGTRYVFFTDSVFNTSPRHVQAVCEAIIRGKLGIEWGCFARPQNLDGDLLDLMIEAGLRHIEFGSDSFCDTTLQTYGKSFRFKDILQASETAASRKVHACHYIIFGGPGETEATIRETVANSKLLPDSPIFAFSGMRIYPHTPLFGQSGTEKSPAELLDPAYYSPDELPAAERE
ncbi:MAG TPA: lipid biosynthesis B12-binding/radical SAM protein, partial [Oceanipulchritudo sp.]|nr:lipid biosynthesis B12-binding/radical SAM protein [Oceanipulchritudo sp.]